jgi:hypothetical protein
MAARRCLKVFCLIPNDRHTLELSLLSRSHGAQELHSAYAPAYNKGCEFNELRFGIPCALQPTRPIPGIRRASSPFCGCLIDGSQDGRGGIQHILKEHEPSGSESFEGPFACDC